jgi:hypothetical protein
MGPRMSTRQFSVKMAFRLVSRSVGALLKHTGRQEQTGSRRPTYRPKNRC